MRWGFLFAMAASLLAFEASAGSVLIYDGRGNVDRVVRSSPSGFIVQDNRGNVDRAVRRSTLHDTVDLSVAESVGI